MEAAAGLCAAALPVVVACVLGRRGRKWRKRQRGSTISGRAEEWRKPFAPYVELVIDAFAGGVYDAETNPEGVVLLAVAEDRFSYEDMGMRAQLQACGALTDAASCYTVPSGMPAVKEQLASFLSHWLARDDSGTVVTSADLVVCAGTNAAVAILSAVLCNAGDAVLLPNPYYPAFPFDLTAVSGVKVELVQTRLDTSPPFTVTRRMLDDALAASGNRAKMLLITNPVNPLGRTLNRAELEVFVSWSAENRIHLVVDELYAFSVFGSKDGGDFVSVLELLQGSLGRYVHVLYGFSKDWGMAGARCGVLISKNTEVLEASGSLVQLFMCSNFAQERLAQLLQREAFLTDFFAKRRDTLASRCELARSTLESVPGVHVHPANATFFLWVDVRALLSKAPPQLTQSYSSRAVAILIAREAELTRALSDAGVVVVPGDSCGCPVPGFMRICYTYALTQAELELGLSRMVRVLREFVTLGGSASRQAAVH